MEILRHHILNLKFLLNRVPEEGVHSRLRWQARSMIRWSTDASSSEPAYPGLQTETGYNKFIDVEEQMFKAIQSGDFTEIDDKNVDDLCRACGNLTTNGCGLKGKSVSRR